MCVTVGGPDVQGSADDALLSHLQDAQPSLSMCMIRLLIVFLCGARAADEALLNHLDDADPSLLRPQFVDVRV